MYAKNHSVDPQIQESGGAESVRRVEYNVPASYGGSAFLADHAPSLAENACERANLSVAEDCTKESGRPSTGGILSGIGAKLERLETDDLLLIGLVLLLSKEKESGMQTLLLLAFLFLTME